MKLSALFIFCAFLCFGCGSDDGKTVDVVDAALTVDDFTVEEGDDESNAFVRVILTFTGDLTSEISATVRTVDGTAIAGEDYEAIESQPLLFSANSKLQEVKIKILGDTDNEPNETFTLELVDVNGASIAKGSGTITIENDDGAGTSIFIPSEGYTTPDNYAGMDLIWQDEFSASTIDESMWTFEIGNGNWGWGNNELEYYRKENAVIDNGYLVITALEEAFNGFDYTSTRMKTQNKFDFNQGRVDIRANMPKGKGIWPALWMLGSNITSVGWPSCGEIDIMEMVGGGASDNTTHGTIHFSNPNGDHVFFGGEKSASGKLNEKFYVYSIVWDETSIRWYLDDVQYHFESITAADRSELKDNDFFFIFNVAVGGNWPGSPDASTTFPQRMIVDYIRVFQ